MAELTLEQVRRVAALARLNLTAEEEERYARQLSAVLEAMEKLNALDTREVQPTSHVSWADSSLRADEVAPSLPPERALANAPARTGTHFAVPKILE